MFVIVRCGWHKKYFGKTKIMGIKLWPGQSGVTDGMCKKCLRIWGKEYVDKKHTYVLNNIVKTGVTVK